MFWKATTAPSLLMDRPHQEKHTLWRYRGKIKPAWGEEENSMCQFPGQGRSLELWAGRNVGKGIWERPAPPAFSSSVNGDFFPRFFHRYLNKSQVYLEQSTSGVASPCLSLRECLCLKGSSGIWESTKVCRVPWHCRIREIPTLLLGFLLCSLLLGMPLWHPAARMDGVGILGERHGITANSRGWNAESVHAPATPRVTEQGFSCGLGWFFLGQAEGI